MPVRPAGSRSPRARALSVNTLAVQLSAVALTFILVALLVVTSSRAAFTGQNDNVANKVSSGAVDLTDNDSDSAMFADVTGLIPDTTVDRCIDVTYTGTVDPTEVRLYAAGAPSGALADYLDLTVEVGPDTADDYGDCTNFKATGGPLYTGTLNGFAAAKDSWANGLPTWDPGVGPEIRTFRFRVSVQSKAEAEGQTATFGFSWETRSS